MPRWPRSRPSTPSCPTTPTNPRPMLKKQPSRWCWSRRCPRPASSPWRPSGGGHGRPRRKRTPNQAATPMSRRPVPAPSISIPKYPRRPSAARGSSSRPPPNPWPRAILPPTGQPRPRSVAVRLFRALASVGAEAPAPARLGRAEPAPRRAPCQKSRPPSMPLPCPLQPRLRWRSNRRHLSEARSSTRRLRRPARDAAARRCRNPMHPKPRLKRIIFRCRNQYDANAWHLPPPRPMLLGLFRLQRPASDLDKNMPAAARTEFPAHRHSLAQLLRGRGGSADGQPSEVLDD